MQHAKIITAVWSENDAKFLIKLISVVFLLKNKTIIVLLSLRRMKKELAFKCVKRNLIITYTDILVKDVHLT